MDNKKITIKQIAEYANVSATTVSYVLNKNPKQKISEETKRRVLEAVEKLHYIPNNAAKALRLNHTYCIGVALEKTLILQRFSQLLEGIRSSLEKSGYSLILCSNECEENGVPEYMNCYFEKKVDGIIYIGCDGIGIEPKYQDIIIKKRIPVVVLDCENISNNISTVNFDYYYGAYKHTEFLIKKGAKKIVYIRPTLNTRQEEEREKGIRDVLIRYPNVKLDIHHIEYSLEKEKELPRITHMFDEEMIGKFSEIVKLNLPKLNKLDVFMCSWGNWVEVIFSQIMKYKGNVNIAGLAEGSMISELWENITYSLLPNYDAGYLCSEIILENIENVTKVRTEVLKPRME